MCSIEKVVPIDKHVYREDALMRSRRLWRLAAALVAAPVLVLSAAACSSDNGGGGGGGSAASGSGGDTGTLRLGYFPNLTHAPALYGVDKGVFSRTLGSGVKLETKTFNSGVQESEAMLSGALDAGFIGPNPAINMFTKSNGSAVRIVSGVTSGGAALVVKPSITSVEQLRGKTIATPSLGNTQDVALRYYLKQHGFNTTKEGGGDVKIRPQDNAVTIDAFRSGAIDGAWVPEPNVARLVDAGGKVLVDEASQWPGGKFVTTVLVVRTDYLKKHPGIVQKLVQANVTSIKELNADPTAGQTATNAALKNLTGKGLSAGPLASAWKKLTFTPDPVASSLRTSAAHAEELGLLKNVKLDGIFDLSVLNTVLKAGGQSAVNS
jgi:NitT/TauT family transport system substrate-binding protein